MKPQNITFMTTFDSYDEAENHWNKIKHKESYGIAVAGGKHFVIKKTAIDAVFEEAQTKPLSDEEIYQLWCESDNTELLPEMRNKDGSINYIILTFAQLIEERHGIK